MSGFLNFKSSEIFTLAKVKKQFDIYEMFMCRTIGEMGITIIKGKGIPVNPYFVIIFSCVLLFLIVRNILLLFCGIKFKVYCSRIVSLLTIVVSFLGISGLAFTLNLFVDNPSVFRSLNHLSDRYKSYERTGIEILDTFDQMNLTKNLKDYEEIVENFKTLSEISKEMILPLIDQKFFPFVEDALKDENLPIGNFDKTLDSMIETGTGLTKSLEFGLNFVETNYNEKIDYFKDQLEDFSESFNFFDDIIIYVKKLLVFFFVNVAILQYGIMIVISLYFISRTYNILQLSRGFTIISYIYLVMLFIATISKYELFVRVEQVCYLLKDFKRDTRPLKYYYYRDEYFKDKDKCFVHWKEKERESSEEVYKIFTEIVDNCVFEKNSTFLETVYDYTKVDDVTLYKYIEDGFNILKKFRRILAKWDQKLPKENSGNNNFVAKTIRTVVKDLKRFYEKFTNQYWGKTTLITKIKDLNSCKFLNELFNFLENQACNVVPNVIFSNIVTDLLSIACLL